MKSENVLQASQEHPYDGNLLSDSTYCKLSEFFYEMDINGEKFTQTFTNNYVQHVFEKHERVSDVIMNTGFSKTVIDQAKKGEKKNKQYVNKEFFGEMIDAIYKICSRNSEMVMKIKGPGSSTFTSVFYKLEPSTKQVSSQSFLEYMIKRGIVERAGDNRIKFLRAVPESHINTKGKMVELFSGVLPRFIHTLIRNFKSKSEKDENFQQTYRSWHIDPSKHDEVRMELKKLIRKQWVEIQALIDSYEAETEFEKNRIEGTGAEIGVSTFVYNFNPNEDS